MKRITAVLGCLILLSAIGLTGCGRELPPGEGTDPLPALDGTYVSEHGSLTFNGDGRSVTLEIGEELSSASGLPAGTGEGTYVFLFRNEEWRYDKAETFRIMIGEEQYQFRNDLSSTDEGIVAFYLDNGETVRFIKE